MDFIFWLVVSLRSHGAQHAFIRKSRKKEVWQVFCALQTCSTWKSGKFKFSAKNLWKWSLKRGGRLMRFNKFIKFYKSSTERTKFMKNISQTCSTRIYSHPWAVIFFSAFSALAKQFMPSWWGNMRTAVEIINEISKMLSHGYYPTKKLLELIGVVYIQQK